MKKKNKPAAKKSPSPKKKKDFEIPKLEKREEIEEVEEIDNEVKELDDPFSSDEEEPEMLEEDRY